MLKLLKSFIFGKNGTEKMEMEALHISGRLQSALKIADLADIPFNQVFHCKNYVVIKEVRYFSTGWHNTLEITTKDCHLPGYTHKGNINPYWITEPKGSNTANVPPKKVVEEVIYHLQNM